MRVTTLLALAASAVILGLSVPAPVSAGGRNPDGVGIYTPAEPPVRHRPRLYRYDPRSWYYNQAGYYPSYGSGYWVPRPKCATGIATATSAPSIAITRPGVMTSALIAGGGDGRRLLSRVLAPALSVSGPHLNVP